MQTKKEKQSDFKSDSSPHHEDEAEFRLLTEIRAQMNDHVRFRKQRCSKVTFEVCVGPPSGSRLFVRKSESLYSDISCNRMRNFKSPI